MAPAFFGFVAAFRLRGLACKFRQFCTIVLGFGTLVCAAMQRLISPAYRDALRDTWRYAINPSQMTAIIARKNLKKFSQDREILKIC